MGSVFRCFVEKRPGFAVEAAGLLGELKGPLGLFLNSASSGFFQGYSLQ